MTIRKERLIEVQDASLNVVFQIVELPRKLRIIDIIFREGNTI